MKQDDALIVGAGIAGLTTALALAQRGISTQVFEQASSLSELGAGLQLSPNAVRVLQDLGLGEALQAAGFQPQAIQVRHWRSGRLLASEPLGKAAESRWGAPYFHMHRADLQQLLLDAIRGHNSIRLQLDAPCTAVGQDNQRAWLRLANGEVQAAALLLAADGIHSAVRAQSFDTKPPRFTGHVAWRLLVPARALPAGLIPPVAGLWMGPGAHFVHYYVRGGDCVNCVCVIEQQGWDEESWTSRGERAELAAAFAGWHTSIQQLIGAAEDQSCYRWALYDRDPMHHFVTGRIALLGDACHPSLPFLAQGAAMAIEDAGCLAGTLATIPDPSSALAAYQSRRRARVGRVQLTSRRNGRVYHLRGLPAWMRDVAMQSGMVGLRRTTDWLYSHKIE